MANKGGTLDNTGRTGSKKVLKDAAKAKDATGPRSTVKSGKTSNLYKKHH